MDVVHFAHSMPAKAGVIPPTSAKRDRETEELIPAKKLNSNVTVEVSTPAVPKPDISESGFAPARSVMKKLIPWVNQELPRAIKRINPTSDLTVLATAKPLQIKAADAKSEGSSYKEAWVPENCAKSCSSSGANWPLLSLFQILTQRERG